ncbi:MAG TPA: hypothetical protein VHX61_02385 [Rhizomicrobium sp.]|jgi:hypothetical protein|nr:hypothetical protein [Rhizomicrobium sp.]
MPPRKKTIKRRAWTPEDVKEFKSLAKAKTPAVKIAHRFKRTEGAIRQKALDLVVSLNARGAPHRTKSHSPGKTVLGVTSDGVRILRQKRSTHFSQRELRNAIALARSGDG